MSAPPVDARLAELHTHPLDEWCPHDCPGRPIQEAERAEGMRPRLEATEAARARVYAHAGRAEVLAGKGDMLGSIAFSMLAEAARREYHAIRSSGVGSV